MPAARGADHVAALYELSRTAQRSKADAKEALRRGATQEYHRILREHPEHKLADALMAIRKHLGDLVGSRRRMMASNLPQDTKDIQGRLLEKSLAATAEGSRRWVTDKLNGRTYER